MNRFKPKTETEQPRATKPQKKGAVSSFGKFLAGYIDERYLGKNFESNIKFLGFLTFIGILYISNVLNAERKIRRTNIINKQIKEMEIEYSVLQSKLQSQSVPSKVEERLASNAIEQSKTPPQILYKP